MKHKMVKDLCFSFLFISILLFLMLLSMISVLYKTKPFSTYMLGDTFKMASVVQEVYRVFMV